MIQDITPHQLFNQYQPDAVPQPHSLVFRFHGSELLVSARHQLPTAADLTGLPAMTYLFSLDDQRCFLLTEDLPWPEGYAFVQLNALREAGFGPKPLLYAAMTAKHLSDWYTDNRYCGRCGALRRHDDRERCMVCPVCRSRSYPRIMPAVIVGVTNGDQLLLTRYRSGYAHNALIAGFTEIGETMEETVAREVMEEAGLHVKNIRYYKSQPWGVANDILMGFYCDVDGDTEIHMDSSELKQAVWTNRQDIVLQPDDLSLTNEMMMMFRDGKR